MPCLASARQCAAAWNVYGVQGREPCSRVREETPWWGTSRPLLRSHPPAILRMAACASGVFWGARHWLFQELRVGGRGAVQIALTFEPPITEHGAPLTI